MEGFGSNPTTSQQSHVRVEDTCALGWDAALPFPQDFNHTMHLELVAIYFAPVLERRRVLQQCILSPTPFLLLSVLGCNFCCTSRFAVLSSPLFLFGCCRHIAIACIGIGRKADSGFAAFRHFHGGCRLRPLAKQAAHHAGPPSRRSRCLHRGIAEVVWGRLRVAVRTRSCQNG